MVKFLKNFSSAIPLALGVLLTLFSIIEAMKGENDSWVPALFLGIIGIPLLFASIIFVIKDE
jgi:hypothetical protein